jgi:signal transduction protein with GAF and PtsI domain
MCPHRSQSKGSNVTDVYIEDPDDQESRLSAIERMRAEVDRMVVQLEHMIQNAGADVADAARLRARYVERKIKSQFALSAAIAVGVGLLIGAAVAGLSARSRSPRR